MAEDLKRVKEFWQEYQAAVLRQGVAQAKAAWFVRWAQRCARAAPGAPLRDLESRTHAEAWQVEQTQEALRVLYQHCPPRSWAQPWPSHTHTPETARALPRRQAFRDELGAHEVEAAHQEVLTRLRTELRARHYSLRTEQAYEHWMRRFVTFHGLKSLRELGPEAVKE